MYGQQYNAFAEAIFTDVSMGSLMASGALLVEPDFHNQIVTTEFQKSIYAQLAVATWAQTIGLTQFITYVLLLNPLTSNLLNCPTAGTTRILQQCRLTLPEATRKHPSAVVSADFSQVNATISGRCYYLLGAQTIDGCRCPTDKRSLDKRVEISGQNQDPQPDSGSHSTGSLKSSCWIINVLSGGTNDVLDGSAYNGLLLADFLKGGVAGWTVTGNTNGYPPVSPSTTIYPQRLQDAGFITHILVCDYEPVNGKRVGLQERIFQICQLLHREMSGLVLHL